MFQIQTTRQLKGSQRYSPIRRLLYQNGYTLSQHDDRGGGLSSSLTDLLPQVILIELVSVCLLYYTTQVFVSLLTMSAKYIGVEKLNLQGPQHMQGYVMESLKFHNFIMPMRSIISERFMSCKKSINCMKLLEIVHQKKRNIY